MTKDEAAPASESQEPTEDFVAFLRGCVKIEHAETHQTVSFEPWTHQETVARELEAGQWLLILKARQLGFTWLLAAFAVWVARQQRRRVLVFFQDKEYASDFLDRCRFINDHLPEAMREKPTADNLTRLEFDKDHRGSYIRALAATKRAGHSLSANLVICDEAAYIERLKQILRAAKPTLETQGGQAVVLSTSNGPSGHFWELWEAMRPPAEAQGAAEQAPAQPQCSQGAQNSNNGSSSAPPASAPGADLRRFKALFFRYDCRPGRDDDWYKREAVNSAHDPSYMKREFPTHSQEAFEAAEGRIYALFSADGEAGKKFVRSVDPKLLAVARHYRGIDFGARDPFVCLWACVLPGEPAGFSIDPRCTNTIRELLSYRYDDKGSPLDQDNHAPDALRYLIITPGRYGLEGHVHVYRELYVENSVSKSLTLIDLARKIGEMSGGQRFELTAADRSRPEDILMLCRQGIRAVAARVLRGERGGELAQGIARVNILINATAKAGEAPVAPPAPKPPKRLPAVNFRLGDPGPALFA